MHKTEKRAKESRLNLMYSYLCDRTLVAYSLLAVIGLVLPMVLVKGGNPAAQKLDFTAERVTEGERYGVALLGIRQTNPSSHAGPILIHSRHDRKRRG
jgi:hypothetical protein